MTKYTSKSGKQSGVINYRIGNDYIILQFPSAKYKYSISSCGKSHIDNMKTHALNSIGLSTYVSQNQPDYEWKKLITI